MKFSFTCQNSESQGAHWLKEYEYTIPVDSVGMLLIWVMIVTYLTQINDTKVERREKAHSNWAKQQGASSKW